MKLIVLMLCLAGTAVAQTNLGFVHFTNRFGFLIEGEVLRVEKNKLQIKHDGVVSSIRLADASPEIQLRFSYDPEREAADKKVEIAQRAAVQKAQNDAATDLWLKSPLPPQKKRTATVEVKITEKNSVYWQLSYVLTLRNPTEDETINDFTINYLDKDGFILDYSKEYNIRSPAMTTNAIRGTTLITVPKAYDYSRPDVVATKRK